MVMKLQGVTSSPQRLPRPFAGVPAVVDYKLTIDDNVENPVAVLERLGVGGPVDHMGGVKDRQVGELAGLDLAPVVKAKFGRVERGHLADGVFQAQQLELADVNSQHARKRAE